MSIDIEIVRQQLYKEKVDSKFILPQHAGGHLSATQLSMYLRCSQQYYFRYVCGLKSPPSLPLIEGSTHHECFNTSNTKYIKTKKYLPLKEAQEKFADEFMVNKKELEKSQMTESADSVVKRGMKIQKLFSDHVTKNGIISLMSEQEIKCSMYGVEILGYIDNICTIKPFLKSDATIVVDYKITGRLKSEYDASKSLQLILYDWFAEEALKLSNKLVGFHSFSKAVTPSDKMVTRRVTVQERRFLFEQILGVLNGIKRGNFMVCNPEWNPLCSEKFCGYWNICRGKK